MEETEEHTNMKRQSCTHYMLNQTKYFDITGNLMYFMHASSAHYATFSCYIYVITFVVTFFVLSLHIDLIASSCSCCRMAYVGFALFLLLSPSFCWYPMCR